MILLLYYREIQDRDHIEHSSGNCKHHDSTHHPTHRRAEEGARRSQIRGSRDAQFLLQKSMMRLHAFDCKLVPRSASYSTAHSHRHFACAANHAFISRSFGGQFHVLLTPSVPRRGAVLAHMKIPAQILCLFLTVLGRLTAAHFQ